MNKNLKLIGGILLVLIGLYFAWYFFNILIYVIIAGVLSFIGQPLVRFFDKIKIKNVKIPHTISAVLSLLVMMLIIASFFMIFVPVISRQANVISHIDFQYLGEMLEHPLHDFEEKLVEYNILSHNMTIEELISTELESLMQLVSVQTIFGNVLGFAGSLFMAIFSIVFLLFFFLRDEHLFYDGIMILVPTKYEEQTAHILKDTRRLLSRYFVGLSIELFSMITLITIGLKIFGVQGALLIGFLGGMMNIIPYLGPIIGATIGVVLGATSNLSLGQYEDVLPFTAIIVGTFVVANLIDNMILQPLIYSTSVKAHPIEIFLVILMAGSLAGIPGMILAIPGYTVLRIVAKQFLTNSKLVKKLTENI